MGKDLQVPCDLYPALSYLASLGKLEYPQTEEARLEVVNNILDEICRMFNIAPSDKHLMATRDIFILLHFWRRRHHSKMEALAWQFGSACPLLKEFAWYPSGDWSRGQLKTRWLWSFGFPDEKGERSAIDRRLFSILPGDKVRIIKIPILVGEMQKLSEERMYHQRRFNPYREYWP
ncbi:hypothetical protein QCA50_002454 [Cerrena zonata]|uniref:Uncharacterized protein n=1 Tax=Cerrena zonata TaxID=2478898 RepID=A0AAW0GTM1_9APHY